MSIRSVALAAALVLLGCGAATAAPVTVQLRVEGSAQTLFDGPVTTDAKTITKGVNTVVCDGTLNGGNSAPGPTATSALDDAAIAAGLTWDASYFGDFFITRFGPQTSDVWGYAVNFKQASVGGCQLQVHPGDDILFASDFFGGPSFAQEGLLRLEGPARAASGRAIGVKVTNGETGAPIGGAAVGGTVTGADGIANVTLTTVGVARLKAEAPGTIRSNSIAVCVSQSGTEDCGAPPAKVVKDSVAPRARIGGLVDGRHYKRGPRLLSGTAADDVGVTKVKLALRRHVHGKPCRWWSGTAERFAGRGCAKKIFFGIDAGANWSYLLPRALSPGRYVLDVKAFDRARNRDERFVRGTNRVVFYVDGRRPARAGTSSRGQAPRVQVLLATRAATYERVTRARTARIRVGGRSCRVGAGTPLAALVPVLKQRGLGYRLHDYGRCARATASASGQLFVNRIGGDANSGNDGWFYKVNDRAPEVGAGDPTARVRSGARVLWFYCVFDDSARSCQRSLRVTPDAGAKAGQSLRVRVRAYDNAGRSAPVQGATVTLGATSAVTDAAGMARVLPPAAGRLVLVAAKPGLVRSFSATVVAG
jgi:Domain of unknown function (DUF4430)